MFSKVPLNQSATVRPLKPELQLPGYNWQRWRYRMWTRLEVCLAIDCCCSCEWSRIYSTTVKVLVVLKVVQLRCEISLNRKHSSKNIYAANVLALEWEKLVSGIKGAFITHYCRNRTVWSARVYAWIVVLSYYKCPPLPGPSTAEYLFPPGPSTAEYLVPPTGPSVAL